MAYDNIGQMLKHMRLRVRHSHSDHHRVSVYPRLASLLPDGSSGWAVFLAAPKSLRGWGHGLLLRTAFSAGNTITWHSAASFRQ